MCYYTHYTERNGNIRLGRKYVVFVICVLEKIGFQFRDQWDVLIEYTMFVRLSVYTPISVKFFYEL